MTRPTSEMSFMNLRMTASTASSASYDGGISSVISVMKLSCSSVFALNANFSSWHSARSESFSSRMEAISIASSLGSGIFPPVHAVAVDVDELLGDLVLVHVVVYGFPAHRDIPVIDYAETARREQRVERHYRVHGRVIQVTVQAQDGELLNRAR